MTGVQTCALPICSYIHYRVNEKSTVFPMSILLIIDINSVTLEDASEEEFHKSVRKILSKLQIAPVVTQMAKKKIYISLY